MTSVIRSRTAFLQQPDLWYFYPFFLLIWNSQSYFKSRSLNALSSKTYDVNRHFRSRRSLQVKFASEEDFIPADSGRLTSAGLLVCVETRKTLVDWIPPSLGDITTNYALLCGAAGHSRSASSSSLLILWKRQAAPGVHHLARCGSVHAVHNRPFLPCLTWRRYYPYHRLRKYFVHFEMGWGRRT